jgi:hypothetical protein
MFCCEQFGDRCGVEARFESILDLPGAAGVTVYAAVHLLVPARDQHDSRETILFFKFPEILL